MKNLKRTINHKKNEIYAHVKDHNDQKTTVTIYSRLRLAQLLENSAAYQEGDGSNLGHYAFF